MNFKSYCRIICLVLLFHASAQASELYDVLPFGPYRNDMQEFTFGIQLDTAVTYDFVSAMQALSRRERQPSLASRRVAEQVRYQRRNLF